MPVLLVRKAFEIALSINGQHLQPCNMAYAWAAQWARLWQLEIHEKNLNGIKIPMQDKNAKQNFKEIRGCEVLPWQ